MKGKETELANEIMEAVHNELLSSDPNLDRLGRVDIAVKITQSLMSNPKLNRIQKRMRKKTPTLKERISQLPRLRLGDLKLRSRPLYTLEELYKNPSDTIFLVRFYKGKHVGPRGVIGFSLLCHELGELAFQKEFDASKALYEILK